MRSGLFRIIIVAAISASAHAYDWSTNPGDGSEAAPFQISTSNQLIAIGSEPTLLDKHFVLVNDIDLLGTTYTNALIASESNFTGCFDANDFTVRNLTMRVQYEPAGLFGWIGENGTVTNLHLENVDIESTANAGGLCCYNRGTIHHCSVSGTVTGNDYVGGICCDNDYDATIIKCGSSVAASGRNRLSTVCGRNEGLITQCYAAGNIDGHTYLGGICGDNGYEAIVENCHSNTSITSGTCTGGICGDNNGSIVYCYNTGYIEETNSNGGICGRNYDGEINNCLWDIETSGMAVGIGLEDEDAFSSNVIGATTAQMRQQNTYIFNGWDFAGESFNGDEDIWRICVEGTDYAQLSWELADNGSNCDPIIETGPYGGGSGTPNDPYLISKPVHLYGLSSPGSGAYCCYLQTANIDMTDLSIQPIGLNRDNYGRVGFIGLYDGGGHTISNLTINGARLPYPSGATVAGLFGKIGYEYSYSGFVQNLHLENVTVTGGDATGTIASVLYRGSIVNCSATGSVHASGLWVGGFIESVYAGIVERCFSDCQINISDESQVMRVGGFVANNYGGTITDCYATGSVILPNAYTYSGGFVEANSGTIHNCYASVSNCQSGFVHSLLSGEILNCFWNTDTSGTTISDGGDPLDDPNMMIQANFTDWDFLGESTNGDYEIWRMCADGVDTPRLSWEFARDGDFACGGGVDLADLQALAECWLLAEATNSTTFSYACDGNGDGIIDLADFAVLSENWE